MSEAIVFVIGAIIGIFIISHFTKSKLDAVEQGTHAAHQAEEREPVDYQNTTGTKPGQQQINSKATYNS
mgnify:CR=1 FL=1